MTLNDEVAGMNEQFTGPDTWLKRARTPTDRCPGTSHGDPSGILLSAADKGFCGSERKRQPLKQPFDNPGVTRIPISGELQPQLK